MRYIETRAGDITKLVGRVKDGRRFSIHFNTYSKLERDEAIKAMDAFADEHGGLAYLDVECEP